MHSCLHLQRSAMQPAASAGCADSRLFLLPPHPLAAKLSGRALTSGELAGQVMGAVSGIIAGTVAGERLEQMGRGLGHVQHAFQPEV